MTDPAAEYLCALCRRPAYGVREHPCCRYWAAELAAGRPCPACAESRRAATIRRAARRRRA